MQPISRILIVLVLALPFHSTAQDTLYLDAKWKKTKLADAAYYRLTWPKEKDHYKVEDHFLDGKMQMLGAYLSTDAENKEARDGYFVYYDHEGNVKSEGNYAAGKHTGTWKYDFVGSTNIKRLVEHETDLISYNTYYDSVTHLKRSEGKYANGEHLGTWKYYFVGSTNLKMQVKHKTDSLGYNIYYDSITNLKRSEGAFKGKQAVGIWKYYFRDGVGVKEQADYLPDSIIHHIRYDSITHTKWAETTNRGKCPIDTARYYNSRTNNVLLEETVFSDCKRTVDRVYTKDGTLERIEIYRQDTIYEGHTYDATGKEVPFFHRTYSFVEQMPEPTLDMNRYIRENLEYPEFARRHNIEGRVIVKFVVNEDGSLSDLQVLRGIGAGCDEAARRVISGMPKWKPGMQNGKAVKVYFVQPFTFKLTNR